MHGPQNVKFLIHGSWHYACLHFTLNPFYSSGASFVLKKENDGLLKWNLIDIFKLSFTLFYCLYFSTGWPTIVCHLTCDQFFFVCLSTPDMFVTFWHPKRAFCVLLGQLDTIYGYHFLYSIFTTVSSLE